MIVVRCPYIPRRGSQKRKTAYFRKKIALCLKKVCCKVCLCENCQRQSCKTFIGLTNRAKMIATSRHLFLSANKMLSYRRETALQGALGLAKSGRLEMEDNILRTL